MAEKNKKVKIPMLNPPAKNTLIEFPGEDGKVLPPWDRVQDIDTNEGWKMTEILYRKNA